MCDEYAGHSCGICTSVMQISYRKIISLPPPGGYLIPSVYLLFLAGLHNYGRYWLKFLGNVRLGS